MFRQLNTEGAYAGVGAGLAICRRIARRHGGEAMFLDCDEGACVELSPSAHQGGPDRSTVQTGRQLEWPSACPCSWSTIGKPTGNDS